MKINTIQKYLVASILLLALQSFAWGHAFLDHSKPRVGSTVKTVPKTVEIWFTEKLNATFSKAKVLNAVGKKVNAKKAQISKKNSALLIVKLPAKLPNGTYKVVWRVTSVDTHVTEGSFSFTVKP